MAQEIQAEFPQKLDFLFKPKRYKVAYGGRGGAKSWGFARALLILGAEKPLRILCARETQKSIKDSVHGLLEAQIRSLGLEEFYEIQQAAIIGVNGTKFTFAGIRQSSVADIKSFEGCDICWVEEAHTVSKHSWEVLIPTIRKDGSEIWITFNPDLESDETYKRYVVSPPNPERATVVKIDWRDNPWFPQTLREEMEELKAKDREAYDHVYEGGCRTIGEGSYFGNVLSDYLIVSLEQVEKLTKGWWKRWMSGDWGFGHYSSFYWHTRGMVEPQDAKAILGLDTQRPISVVITYREWLGRGMSEREIAETLLSASSEQERGKIPYGSTTGLPEKVRALYFSPDAFEQSIRRSGQNTIADEIGKVLREGGLPYPAKANNARVSGWRAMYGLMANTKRAYEQEYADCLWFVSQDCPTLIQALPKASKDPDKLDDMLRMDEEQADEFQDALDGCRYGILCREVRDNAEPIESRNARILAALPTPQDRYMRSFSLPKAKGNNFNWKVR